MSGDPDTQVRTIQNISGVIGGLALLFYAVAFVAERANSAGAATAYRQLAAGQATVITYTVPGSGTCRAVLVDDKRHGETCEGEK